MSGGLMQLVAYGAQDVYLTGNPQITFFKVVFRRHTNFSMEAIEQTFNGTSDFGRRISSIISRNGDLISYVYVQVDVPELPASNGDENNLELYAWTPELGHALIRSVDVLIGGQLIDRQYGEWLHIWKELTIPSGKVMGYDKMIGNINKMITFDASKPKPSRRIYIPLQFWFCRDTGNALPLISLQYHEVRIEIEFRPIEDLVITKTVNSTGDLQDCFTGLSKYNGDPLSIVRTNLYVDYIYLDTDERRRFAQASHEYLIEQLQFSGRETITSDNIRTKLNFNHPSKELIWVAQHEHMTQVNQWFNFTDRIQPVVKTSIDPDPVVCEYIDEGENPIDVAKILLNGHDRFSERQGEYFNWVQTWQHHSNIPEEGINVYSFALNPEKHQPSGTSNFSRIDNTLLNTRYKPFIKPNNEEIDFTGSLMVFTMNYNILRIMSGMGGLAFSN
jgi:hypothetical protein